MHDSQRPFPPCPSRYPGHVRTARRPAGPATPRWLVRLVVVTALVGVGAGIGGGLVYLGLHALQHLAFGYSEGDFPETEKAARENLCLPLWAGISEEQQREVVAVLQGAGDLVAP